MKIKGNTQAIPEHVACAPDENLWSAEDVDIFVRSRGDRAPDNLLCPVSYTMMNDPVTTATGSVYQREAIERWLGPHNTDPCTNLVLVHKILTPNTRIRRSYEAFRDAALAKDSACDKLFPPPRGADAAALFDELPRYVGDSDDGMSADDLHSGSGTLDLEQKMQLVCERIEQQIREQRNRMGQLRNEARRFLNVGDKDSYDLYVDQVVMIEIFVRKLQHALTTIRYIHTRLQSEDGPVAVV